MADRIRNAPEGGVEGTGRLPQSSRQGWTTKKPIVVLDHEPRELQKLADAGVDLDLCGHAQWAGVPWECDHQTVLGKCLRIHAKDGMHYIVTSGVGLFGPNMRVATVPGNLHRERKNFSESSPEIISRQTCGTKIVRTEPEAMERTGRRKTKDHSGLVPAARTCGQLNLRMR